MKDRITDTIWVSRIDLADPSYVGGTGIIFPFFSDLDQVVRYAVLQTRIVMSVLWASRTLRLLQEGKLKTAKS